MKGPELARFDAITDAVRDGLIVFVQHGYDRRQALEFALQQIRMHVPPELDFIATGRGDEFLDEVKKHRLQASRDLICKSRSAGKVKCSHCELKVIPRRERKRRLCPFCAREP